MGPDPHPWPRAMDLCAAPRRRCEDRSRLARACSPGGAGRVSDAAAWVGGRSQLGGCREPPLSWCHGDRMLANNRGHGYGERPYEVVVRPSGRAAPARRLRAEKSHDPLTDDGRFCLAPNPTVAPKDKEAGMAGPTGDREGRSRRRPTPLRRRSAPREGDVDVATWLVEEVLRRSPIANSMSASPGEMTVGTFVSLAHTAGLAVCLVAVDPPNSHPNPGSDLRS